jgi:hypothetical protein
MKKLIIILIAILSVHLVNAQTDYNKFSFGAGIGLNYGGFGANFSFAPIQYLSITAHSGFNLVDLNAGIGANLYLLPRTKLYRPILKAFYGYNGVILVIGKSEYNKSYYGPTFGIGNEFRFGKARRHGFDIDLLIPIRPQEFSDDVDEMQNDPEVSSFNEPSPVAFSLAYHYDF